MLPRHRRLFIAAGAAAAVIAGGLTMHRPAAVAQDASIAARGPSLNSSDRDTILTNAVTRASNLQSAVRHSGATFLKTRMHIAVVDRSGRVIGFRSMDDAWEGSRDIAIAKARTAAFFSSNENALSSRTIGVLSQAHATDGTGGAAPLWGVWASNQPGITGGNSTRNGVITFPGGLPLYKNGVLVGGVGASGDGVDQDEAVAISASVGYTPPDTIIDQPYTRSPALP